MRAVNVRCVCVRTCIVHGSCAALSSSNGARPVAQRDCQLHHWHCTHCNHSSWQAVTCISQWQYESVRASDQLGFCAHNIANVLAHPAALMLTGQMLLSQKVTATNPCAWHDRQVRSRRRVCIAHVAVVDRSVEPAERPQDKDKLHNGSAMRQTIELQPPDFPEAVQVRS